MSSLAKLRERYPDAAYQVLPWQDLSPGDFFWYARRAADGIEIMLGSGRTRHVPAHACRLCIPPDRAAAAAASKQDWDAFLDAATQTEGDPAP